MGRSNISHSFMGKDRIDRMRDRMKRGLEIERGRIEIPHMIIYNIYEKFMGSIKIELESIVRKSEKSIRFEGRFIESA